MPACGAANKPPPPTFFTLRGLATGNVPAPTRSTRRRYVGDRAVENFYSPGGSAKSLWVTDPSSTPLNKGVLGLLHRHLDLFLYLIPAN
jgi:hypothetical protein